MNRALEQHRYHEVAEELWQFFWHDFCDWYLEIKKLRLSPNSGLTNDWRNLLASSAHICGCSIPSCRSLPRNCGIASDRTLRSRWRRIRRRAPSDEAAEHEMGLLQEMVTAARKLKADNGLDDKLELAGVLYCRNGSRNVELPVVECLAKVKLEVRTDAPLALTGAVRSTAQFDLSAPASGSGSRGAAPAADERERQAAKAGREYRSPARQVKSS